MSFVRRRSGLYVPVGSVPLPTAGAGAPVPLPTWAPTSEGELDRWIDEQAGAWERPATQAAIAEARDRITDGLSQGDSSYVAPTGRTLDDAAIAEWAAKDILDNGFPQNPEQAAQMTSRLLDAQGESMGFHPAFVGEGVHLVLEGFPDNADAAEAWGMYVAQNIAAQYGFSVPTDWDAKGAVMAASSAACLQAGVPYVGVVTTSIDALWDGKLTEDEIKNIVVAVGSVVGAAIGQYFGIPAPIGAFIGAITTELIYGVLADAFGWGPSAAELRGRAWNAMLEAKAAMETQCLNAATKAWNQYNDYWNQLVDNFRATLNAQAPLMGAGLRTFGSRYVAMIEDGEGAEHVLFRPIVTRCHELTGCLYWGTAGAAPIGYERIPAASPQRVDEMPYVIPVPGWPGAMLPDGSIDPYTALAYYGANRYATPFQALLELNGIDNALTRVTGELCYTGGRTSGARTECWGAQLHTDREYLENLARVRSALRPEDLEMCVVPAWATYMLASLVQVGPAASFVMGDCSSTVGAVAAEQEIQARMAVALDDYQASRQVIVQAAQERRDILRMRRDRASREARLNYGLMAAGAGSLAAWALRGILGKR